MGWGGWSGDFSFGVMSGDGDIVRRFQETVRRWRLFEKGERVLVGVSGGIDSVVLLHLLLRIPKERRPTVVAAHFNHRLRRGSAKDERLVRRLCASWSVPLVTGIASPWRDRRNLEARAREARYHFLKRVASRRGIRKIATAHQADDQAETFLIRWLQGAGLRGLAGIPLVREEGKFLLVRPLLLAGRREIVSYARSHRIPFVVDPTNAGDGNLRSRIRRRMSFFRRENPRIAARTAENALFLRADEDFLASVTEDLFRRQVLRNGKSVRCLVGDYLRQPPAVRYRFLQRMMHELRSGLLPAETVFQVDDLLRHPSPRKRFDLPNGVGLKKEYVRFELFRK